MSLVVSANVTRRRPRVEAAHGYVRERRIIQALSVALLVGMPLLGIFRVDVAGRYMVLVWQRLPLAWLAVILPVMIMVPLGTFFILAGRYGRLFCSWACPQGAINEAVAKSHLKMWGRRKPWLTWRDRAYPKSAKRRAAWWQLRGSDRGRAAAWYLGRGLVFPPLAAFAIVSYGLAPATLADYITSGEWAQPAVLLFVGLSGMLYADVFLLQETACRVCFFGYLQSIVSYSQRTGVRRNQEGKSRCHGCSGCRDVCFAGVDPRQRTWEWARSTDLVFDNCVSCGDCLLACDDLTSRRGIPLVMELPPRVVSEPLPGAQASP